MNTFKMFKVSVQKKNVDLNTGPSSATLNVYSEIFNMAVLSFSVAFVFIR